VNSWSSFLSSVGTAQSLSLQHVIAAMLLSFVLCSIIAKLYQLTFQSLSYSRSFVHTLILGGMITCMVMMSMGGQHRPWCWSPWRSISDSF
jgi:hypothetical protein